MRRASQKLSSSLDRPKWSNVLFCFPRWLTDVGCGTSNVGTVRAQEFRNNLNESYRHASSIIRSAVTLASETHIGGGIATGVIHHGSVLPRWGSSGYSLFRQPRTSRLPPLCVGHLDPPKAAV